jgi:hypothetical protein
MTSSFSFKTILFLSIILLSYSNQSTKFRGSQLNQKVNYKMNNSHNEITYKVEGICNKETCKNGRCDNESLCICNKEYAFLKDNYNRDAELCNYRLKDQKIAFLLELILIFGIGHFYCHRILYGALKVAIILSTLIIDYFLKKSTYKKSLTTQNIISYLSYSMYFGLIVFQLFDVIMFGLNKHTDGYGFALYFHNN